MGSYFKLQPTGFNTYIGPAWFSTYIWFGMPIKLSQGYIPQRTPHAILSFPRLGYFLFWGWPPGFHSRAPTKISVTDVSKWAPEVALAVLRQHGSYSEAALGRLFFIIKHCLRTWSGALSQCNWILFQSREQGLLGRGVFSNWLLGCFSEQVTFCWNLFQCARRGFAGWIPVSLGVIRSRAHCLPSQSPRAQPGLPVLMEILQKVLSEIHVFKRRVDAALRDRV